MIVDVHTHVWECPCHIGERFVHDAKVTAGDGYKDIHVDLDKHWAAMEPVDRAIVLGFRARHVGVLVPNEYVAEYVGRHPEKLIGFCSIDPQDPDAVEQLDHCVQTLKLQGLKMGPIYQNVAPTDSRFRRILKRAEELRIPMLIHQGTTFCENVSLEIANPILLQPLALEFPKLVTVIAHMGHPWINETLVLIRKNRNMYADISALFYRPWQFYNALVAAMEYGVLDRLLLGSDYPFTTPQGTMDALRAVNRMAEGTNLPRIPEKAIEAMIGRDTLGLLGIG
ncbi:amidohydrolase family protein [uncultured Paludibaculum sp.]|uniref:amidohydrolase family protein n=1 Tax=uncultured Paludibaculum sp. TaxID=1765020 RepID=UPI002AAC0502|nr:amidohydrolase family protein [uncultured Paludibaculum sp.]